MLAIVDLDDRVPALEVVDPEAQLSGAYDQLTRDGGHCSVHVAQLTFERVEHVQSSQTPRLDLQARKQFMEMPAQPILDSRSLSDQVLAVINQQPYLSSSSVQLRGW